MWYFTWILGLGFAVLLATMNLLWLEAQDARALPAPADPD
ncbi:MAG: cytochrome bd-I oxidase subunit CydX [Nevskiales bacterium]|nr:cytochrome bd-I oxidase subunit CydX [Nevskiales bacterium]